MLINALVFLLKYASGFALPLLAFVEVDVSRWVGNRKPKRVRATPRCLTLCVFTQLRYG